MFLCYDSKLVTLKVYATGLSLGINLTSSIGIGSDRCRRLVVRASRYQLCQTKRNRSRTSLARTHGFRRRMRTTSGRALLKRRRDKGRKILCTKSSPNDGKRVLIRWWGLLVGISVDHVLLLSLSLYLSCGKIWFAMSCVCGWSMYLESLFNTLLLIIKVLESFLLPVLHFLWSRPSRFWACLMLTKL